jgi:GLPGLI family protein
LDAQNDEGYVIYKASLTSSYNYTDELKSNYPDFYKESILTDSLIKSKFIGIVFNQEKSNSFLLTSSLNNEERHLNALSKINYDATYYYNTKLKISKIYREFWLKHVLISVDMKDKWKIDLDKTKTIDGYKCYYAVYKGSYLWAPRSGDNLITAWFTTDIPLPYGPLHYNGLPGLILELNEDNVRFTATKITFDKTYESELKPLDEKDKEAYLEQDFIDSRMDIRNRAKRIMTGG